MKNLLFALLAALVVTASAQPSADEALERGRQLTQAFYAGELAPIAQDFSAEMLRAVGDESALRNVREQLWSSPVSVDRFQLELDCSGRTVHEESFHLCALPS